MLIPVDGRLSTPSSHSRQDAMRRLFYRISTRVNRRPRRVTSRPWIQRIPCWYILCVRARINLSTHDSISPVRCDGRIT